MKHNKDIALFLKKIRGKGGGSMIKETIQAVEDAEAKASELVAQASEDARRVKAEAEAEADRMLAVSWKKVLNQMPGLQIVTPQSAEVFRDDKVDLPALNGSQHSL